MCNTPCPHAHTPGQHTHARPTEIHPRLYIHITHPAHTHTHTRPTYTSQASRHAATPIHTCNTPCPRVHMLHAHMLGNMHIPGNVNGNIHTPIAIHTCTTPHAHTHYMHTHITCTHTLRAHTLGNMHRHIPIHMCNSLCPLTHSLLHAHSHTYTEPQHPTQTCARTHVLICTPTHVPTP